VKRAERPAPRDPERGPPVPQGRKGEPLHQRWLQISKLELKKHRLTEAVGKGAGETHCSTRERGVTWGGNEKENIRATAGKATGVVATLHPQAEAIWISDARRRSEHM